MMSKFSYSDTCELQTTHCGKNTTFNLPFDRTWHKQRTLTMTQKNWHVTHLPVQVHSVCHNSKQGSTTHRKQSHFPQKNHILVTSLQQWQTQLHSMLPYTSISILKLRQNLDTVNGHRFTIMKDFHYPVQ